MTEYNREDWIEERTFNQHGPRLVGVVSGIDAAGSTAWIVSDDGTYLAFSRPLKLTEGMKISFRIDGMRAKDLILEGAV